MNTTSRRLRAELRDGWRAPPGARHSPPPSAAAVRYHVWPSQTTISLGSGVGSSSALVGAVAFVVTALHIISVWPRPASAAWDFRRARLATISPALRLSFLLRHRNDASIAIAYARSVAIRASRTRRIKSWILFCSCSTTRAGEFSVLTFRRRRHRRHRDYTRSEEMGEMKIHTAPSEDENERFALLSQTDTNT